MSPFGATRRIQRNFWSNDGRPGFTAVVGSDVEIDAFLFHVAAFLGDRKDHELKRFRGQGGVYFIERECRLSGKTE